MSEMVYGPTAEPVARALLHSGAYLIRTDVGEDRFWTWKSGIKAPTYCNCRQIVGNPGATQIVQKALGRSIRANFPEAKCVVGVAEAGIMWSMAAALELSLAHAFVQKRAKEHGMAGRVACSPTRDICAVLVDDLVASGESLEESIHLLREECGIRTVGIQSIVNWGFAEMRQRFDRLQIPVRCLVSYGGVLAAAFDARLISSDARNELERFYSSPRDHKWNVAALTKYGASFQPGTAL